MFRSIFRRAFVLPAIFLAASVALVGLARSATTLNTTIKARIEASYASGATIGAPTLNMGAANEPDIVLAQGTGANQADLIYVGRRTISASSSETLDLTGSGASLSDPFGTSLSFLHVKAVLIRAAAANTNNVVVGNAGSNVFVGPMAGTTPTTSIQPGGVMMWLAPGTGWAVADGSTDSLKVANSSSGTSVTYDLYIIGTDS